MKYIKWIGVPMLGAAGVALLVATASAGDRAFIRRTPKEESLNVTKRLCYANWLHSVWPAISQNDMRALHTESYMDGDSKRHKAKALREETDTSSEFEANEDLGLVENVISRSGDDVTYNVWTTWVDPLTSGQRTSLATCVELVWPAIDGELIEHLFVDRIGGAGAGVDSWLHYHDTEDLLDYIDLLVVCNDPSQFCEVVGATGTVAE